VENKISIYLYLSITTSLYIYHGICFWNGFWSALVCSVYRMFLSILPRDCVNCALSTRTTDKGKVIDRYREASCVVYL